MSVPPHARTDACPPHDSHSRALRLLFVASEAYPLAKTGGLADVNGALPLQLLGLGIDVRLMLPAYTEALERLGDPEDEIDLGEVLPGLHVRLIQGRLSGSGLPVWLVDCPPLFRRAGGFYQDPEGRDWADNALRFALLAHVAARVALGRTRLDWKADVVHAHDWHTGLVPLLVAAGGAERPRTVFTIHNMAFQGLFPLEAASQLGLPEGILTPECAEFYGHLSFLKAGIVAADRVTTVSPTYAREIRSAEFGFGMEGVLQARGEQLVGILNGIDTQVWNPATDDSLAQRYTPEDMSGKAVCKQDLQRHLGLAVDPDAPLAVSLSRLTHQKMADVMLACLPAMLSRHPRLQVVVHGCGDHALEQGIASLAPAYPGRLAVRIGYQEALEHRMHAGADILLHGSRFEPCGLAQLYAMHYGTLPIVRHVGGLADTVIDAGEPPHRTIGATGFVFQQPDGEALQSALDRCLVVYQAWPRIWSDMRRLAMVGEFGWARPAREYARLYADLVPASRDRPGHGIPRAPRKAAALQGLNVAARRQAMSNVNPEDDQRTSRSSGSGRS